MNEKASFYNPTVKVAYGNTPNMETILAITKRKKKLKFNRPYDARNFSHHAKFP